MQLFDMDIHSAAHSFVPERLTLAREWRGVSKGELADRIGKTASAISQFESKRLRPDAQTIGRLGLTLGLPVQFFARQMDGPRLTSESCHYRRLRAASHKDRKQLQARGSLLAEIILTIGEEVEWQQERISALASFPRNNEEIEMLALKVRHEWKLGLGPISHVIRLLENKGAVITNIPGRNSDVDAFSAWHERFPLIFLISEKGSSSRIRFDASHELGHLIMHADVAPGDREVERQADRFASALLMPKSSFGTECPSIFNFEHFLELKKRWKVSVAAMVRRGFDLGCLSEASYRRAYVFLNQNGYRHNEPNEPPAEIPQLLGRAMAIASENLPFPDIARRLGIQTSDLLDLLKYSAPEVGPASNTEL